MRKKEYCIKCEREYDGCYPCPCGCFSFEIKQDVSGRSSE